VPSVHRVARRRLVSTLRDNLDRFRKLADETARDPTPDRVHDLRVVTRRIRADFWLVPRPHRSRAIRRARRDLEHLAAILGEQRKYDVAMGDAARYGSQTRRIEQRLQVAQRKVSRALGDKDRRRCARRLTRAISDLNELDNAVLGSRVPRLARRLEVARHCPPKTNAARHRLRIDVKRARYLLEATRRPAAHLERLQDHLGRWHDLMLLLKVAGRRKAVTAACAREWRLAKRCLQPALRQAMRELLLLVTDERLE